MAKRPNYTLNGVYMQSMCTCVPSHVFFQVMQYYSIDNTFKPCVYIGYYTS